MASVTEPLISEEPGASEEDSGGFGPMPPAAPAKPRVVLFALVRKNVRIMTRYKRFWAFSLIMPLAFTLGVAALSVAIGASLDSSSGATENVDNVGTLHTMKTILYATNNGESLGNVVPPSGFWGAARQVNGWPASFELATKAAIGRKSLDAATGTGLPYAGERVYSAWEVREEAGRMIVTCNFGLS